MLLVVDATTVYAPNRHQYRLKIDIQAYYNYIRVHLLTVLSILLVSLWTSTEYPLGSDCSMFPSWGKVLF